jgi:hypothetical protein
VTINVEITIHDEGLLDARVLHNLLGYVDHIARRAAVEVVRDFVDEFGYGSLVRDAASFRIWTDPQSLFWIEYIGPGSKTLKGIILSAIISTALSSTVGESIKEGWKHTVSHEYIAAYVPKIESYFIQHFKELWSRNDTLPPTHTFELEPIAINSRDGDWYVQIRVRQVAKKPLNMK